MKQTKLATVCAANLGGNISNFACGVETIKYCDVIMGAMAYQITRITIVYSTVHSRKHQSYVSLAFVWGIHRWPVNSPHKWPVTRKNVSIWWRHHAYSLSLYLIGKMNSNQIDITVRHTEEARGHIDGLVQVCSNSIAKAMELWSYCSLALSHRYERTETAMAMYFQVSPKIISGRK